VPNTMTLVDIGELHEAVVNGYLGGQRQTFYNLMLQTPGNYGNLGTVLSDEATKVGLSAAQLSAFTNAIKMAFKGGSYGYGSPLLYYYSLAAWVSLPFLTTGGVDNREYVTGVFIDSATNATNIGNALNIGSAEVLRDVVNAAMQTWKNH